VFLNYIYNIPKIVKKNKIESAARKQAGYQVINQRVRSLLQVARCTKIHNQYNIPISRKL
jgi:hypothetical protein